MEKVRWSTPGVVQANIEAIAELFPNIMTESVDDDGNLVRTIDFDQLRQELSDHVVEGPQERYRLDWPGKRAAMLAANAPTRSTLRPMLEDSVDFDSTKNIFIEGDNLEALKIIQESYLGKVKLIYIDPPYNTGNDFIYNDDFSESRAEYLEGSGQVDESGVRLVANTESNGRFHSDWLSMMFPRLKLAHSLLRSDGLIAVSIGDREAHNLQRLLDSIFGAGNHIATLAWKKRGTGGQVASNAIIKQVEYVLLYARDISNVALSGPKNVNEGAEKWRDFRKAGGQWQRRFRPNQYYPFYLDPTGKLSLDASPNAIAIYPQNSKAEDGFWENGIETARKRLAAGEFRPQQSRSGWKVQQLEIAKATRNAGSFIDIPSTRGTEELRELFGTVLFENPKPTELLEYMFTLADLQSGDLVLDFFAGSGSTGHATWKFAENTGTVPNFILIQIGEPTSADSEAGALGFSTIAQLSRDRLRRAGLAERQQESFSDVQLDTGFRALRVDSSAFKGLLVTPDETSQEMLALGAENIKGERSQLDLVFQVLVDWGLELSLRISEISSANGPYFDVNDGGLICCFNSELTPNLVREIAAKTPVRAVFRDLAFASDAERINVDQIFRELSPDTQVKVI